jgi:diadenosine tetraphosphatase ApaH/serine/threonine PP2A family protein phosphatase
LRIAIISDIHGNLEALTRAFEYIDSAGTDRVVCLGDIVGYGANPTECLSLVRERTGSIVLGNHDEAAFDSQQNESFTPNARTAIEWTSRRLDESEKRFLRSLPYQISFDGMLFVHASPRHPERWDYLLGVMEARGCDAAFGERICFIGHTHLPFVCPMKPSIRGYNPESRFIINCGSIGQPRDRDPRSSFGLLDTVAGTYENIRLEYDIKTAADKIRAAGLPAALADRLFKGK